MSVVTRLYRGETRFDFIGHRKWWYGLSGLLIVVSIFSFAFRGFNYSIDFAGGTQFQIPVTHTSISTGEVSTAFTAAGATPADVPQQVGSGSTRQIVVKTASLDPAKQQTLKDDVAKTLKLSSGDITITSVSSSWGHDISVKAIEGLIIFLIVVSIYISLRFQWRMAVGALVGLLHDLVIAAGVYSIVGFAVSPSTIVGLLTILGFSLYDTVVVFDKVRENTRGLFEEGKMTFSEASNLAVNQTLMRSINTSLISLLPVAGLLFVGVGILGVGTIEDLALILFVGLASGAYSSLFLCTPIMVEITERDPKYKAFTRRVLARRASEARRTGESLEAVAAAATSVETVAPRRRSGVPAPAPRPGARPQRRKR